MGAARRSEVSTNQVAMGLFLASEAVFFIMLAVAYVLFRDAAPWPAAKRPLDAQLTGFYTLALLSSSVTWWLAERSSRRQRITAQRFWMLLTVALGAVFMVGQVREYLRLIAGQVTVAKGGLFASTFFTLTGFHGLHVLVGVTVLAIMTGLACIKQATLVAPTALATIGWYWHFVDAVWVVIFALVYLWR